MNDRSAPQDPTWMLSRFVDQVGVAPLLDALAALCQERVEKYEREGLPRWISDPWRRAVFHVEYAATVVEV